jgi:hypothetical protein
MRKALMALAAVSLLVVAVPAPASADTGCGAGWGDIYVFSGYDAAAGEESLVSYTPPVPEGACLVVTEGDGVDPRVIYPGSNVVMVRFLAANLGPGTTLQGHVSGLGADTDITLTYTDILNQGVIVYDGPLVDIDPLVQGELVVTVDLPVGDDETETFTDTYRTIDRF